MNFPSLRQLSVLTPHWLIAAAVIAVTVVIVLVLFRTLRVLVLRIVGTNNWLFHSILGRAATLLRFAVSLLAVAIVTPLLPLDSATTGAMNRFEIAALVLMLGWIALVASNLAVERYVARFRMDAEDNLLARKAITQMRVLKRTLQVLIVVIAAGFALMTFESVRQYGISLFASAGVAGLAVGLAAKPLLGNLIAGVQIALTQPIRIDDAVVVENEWGWIEEFTSTYVVIRLWDWRRMVVPLGYFLEHPFQNWTRTTASIIGTVLFHLDYSVPVAALRKKLEELAKASTLWDGQVLSLQVTDTTERSVEVRALVSARSSSKAYDLRCEIREKMLAFLQTEYPQALPRLRADVFAGKQPASSAPARP
jgi:small-conductance mechanosensitive channel